jgi:hypothetical protein
MVYDHDGLNIGHSCMTQHILWKKKEIEQILQLAICQLICNMYDWKYFVILVPTSYVNVSENYTLHFVFYIISF